MKKYILLFPLFYSISLFSQNDNNNNNLGEVHGNAQVEAQYYNPDSTIGAPSVPEKNADEQLCQY